MYHHRHSSRKQGTPGNNEQPGTTTTGTAVAPATAAQEGRGRLTSPFHLKLLILCIFFFVSFSTIKNIVVLDNQKQDHSSNKEDLLEDIIPTTPKILNAHKNPMLSSTNMTTQQLRQQELDDSVPHELDLKKFTLAKTSSATEKEAVKAIIINKDETGIACNVFNVTTQITNKTDLEIRCTDSVGINGQWVRKLDRTFAAGPFCCGWDWFPRGVRHDKVHCRQELAGGGNPKWYSGETGEFYQQIGGKACTCAYNGFKDEFVWESPMLPKTSFNPTDTCDKLGNRTVLMIGDSTMQQVASVLMNSFFPNKCQAQIRFGLSDTLILRTRREGERGRRWDEVVRMFPSDIIILSGGAHVQTGESFKKMVDTVLDEIKTMGPHNMTFGFKTQQPGGCTKEISPLNPAVADRAYNYSSYKSYNHRHFYQRDLYLLSGLQRDNIPALDMRMLYSRGDAKINSMNFDQVGEDKDCLHECYPGPIDIIGRLFDQFLDNIDNRSNSVFDG